MEGVSVTEAAAKLHDGSTTIPAVLWVKRPEKPERLKRIWLPKLQVPTHSDLLVLSATRSIAIDALVIAVTRGFIWSFDDERNGRCWLYTDRRRKCAIRRRIDNLPFTPKNGEPAKAAACSQSDVMIPMGYEEAKLFPFFAVTEGGPNGLAIIAQALASGVEDLVAPVVMPCSASNFTPESLE
jgi:hypothetical protein